jgi:predicted RNA-binding Zn ribbon-like protein
VLLNARDVLDFLVASGALAAADAGRARASLLAPGASDAFFVRALELRTAVTAALIASEHGRALDAASLAVINATLEADAGYSRLEHRRGTTYALVTERVSDAPARLLAPIALAIARLLTMARAPVRKCAAQTCVRHFYDDSRTRRRRWCDMAICGNRAKAAAFAERQRGT